MNGHINKPVDYDEVRRLIGNEMISEKIIIGDGVSGLKCHKTRPQCLDKWEQIL